MRIESPITQKCGGWFSVFLFGWIAISVAGCGNDNESNTEDTGTEDKDTEDKDTEDTDTGPPPTECFDGLPFLEFDKTAKQFAYDRVSPDFVVNTTAGEFRLSDHFDGCDHFVFVLYTPAQDSFWNSSVFSLVADSAPNTHYFFVSCDPSADDAELEAKVREIEAKVNDRIDNLPKEDQAYWSERYHYVTDYGRDIGVVDAILNVNPAELHFTIDRHQLIREGHNVATYSGVWTNQLSNIRYWTKYYNGQYLLDSALVEQETTEDILVHRVAERQDLKGGEPFLWTLPDGKAIDNYEKLEVDMHVDCPGLGHPYRDTCGEWDTVGSLWLCGDEKCTEKNRRRIVKWITPYSAPGRWLIDITPEMVFLGGGGEMRFMLSHGDYNVGQYTYKYTVDFRFSHSEDGFKPASVVPLIPRGNYPFATMGDDFDPFDVLAPSLFTKAEIYARISGHGMVSPSNCAEFCTFEHRFNVNGDDYEHVYLNEIQNRCAEWVGIGVTPNQGGTWWYDRSSWCPGYVIEEWRADVTKSLIPDNPNIIEHFPTRGGGPPPGGNMDARVELVFYL